MKNLRLIALLALAVFWAVPAVRAEVPISPKMAKAVRPITTEEEIDMGREVAANVIAQFGLSQDEALSEYVNLVGLTVARAAPRQDVAYRFAVLDTGVVNALAAPGGYIFVTKGLLALLKDEAQLAAVLAHEVAHVSQRHVVEAVRKSRIADAVIPNYVKASARKAEFMSQVADLAVETAWKGLSREDELQADRLGIEYAAKAGYDTAAYREVLESIKERSGSPDASKELKFLLSTHPKAEDRLAAVDEALKTASLKGSRLEDRFKKSTEKN